MGQALTEALGRQVRIRRLWGGNRADGRSALSLSHRSVGRFYLVYEVQTRRQKIGNFFG